MHYVKVYGLQRSGTNFVRYLLETNFENVTVLFDVLGWKHGSLRYPASMNMVEWSEDPHVIQSLRNKYSDQEIIELAKLYNSGNMITVAVVKPLLSWLISINNWNQDNHLNGNFPPADKIASDCREWIEKVQSYMTAARVFSNWFILESHDNLIDPSTCVNFLTRVGELGQYHKAGEAWITTADNKFEHNNDYNMNLETKEVKFEPSWYLEKQYIKKYDQSTISIILELIPPELEQFIGL